MDMKKQLMELIKNMPPHEGNNFEEALAKHLIRCDVKVVGRCEICTHYPHGECEIFHICQGDNFFCGKFELMED